MNTIMRANVDESDLDVVHEVPSKRTDKKRVVVVAFRHRYKRDLVLQCKKALGEWNRNLNDSSERVYVNKQLSPENRKLYALAAKRKFELNFKFLWTKNGVCFLRKDEQSRYFKFSTVDELSQVR